MKPHKMFKRDGAELYCRAPIPMTSAALGGDIEVPTIDGKKTSVKIPPGTQTGQQFRLKGKGMPVMRSSNRGDMFIEVFVETPVNLNKKQQELIRELDESVTGKNKSKHSPESSGFLGKVKELWDDLKE
jgi:molecular chaperone DnaJ